MRHIAAPLLFILLAIVGCNSDDTVYAPVTLDIIRVDAVVDGHTITHVDKYGLKLPADFNKLTLTMQVKHNVNIVSRHIDFVFYETNNTIFSFSAIFIPPVPVIPDFDTVSIPFCITSLAGPLAEGQYVAYLWVKSNNYTSPYAIVEIDVYE